MTGKPENPQAFPVSSEGAQALEFGMTLRDYFAGQALGGICADGAPDFTYQHEIAAAAYACADEMLKQRSK